MSDPRGERTEDLIFLVRVRPNEVEVESASTGLRLELAANGKLSRSNNSSSTSRCTVFGGSSGAGAVCEIGMGTESSGIQGGSVGQSGPSSKNREVTAWEPCQNGPKNATCCTMPQLLWISNQESWSRGRLISKQV